MRSPNRCSPGGTATTCISPLSPSPAPLQYSWQSCCTAADSAATSSSSFWGQTRCCCCFRACLMGPRSWARASKNSGERTDHQEGAGACPDNQKEAAKWPCLAPMYKVCCFIDRITHGRSHSMMGLSPSLASSMTASEGSTRAGAWARAPLQAPRCPGTLPRPCKRRPACTDRAVEDCGPRPMACMSAPHTWSTSTQ